ncbi:hypothetical protein EST38_g1976 [Candolleomyces aberdarensis]|uniref:Cryptic loci regulator 2 N-terminal domain-containing protein n=1 Tax=Candolleomyces aberdarensis TaxID=2316362 RepID=A0A4Q2DY17_9AGAR|nr:hypothetical protein EST38_g1976 [Candolleomyces aberdarensis]
MRNATGNPNLRIPANPVYIDFPRTDGDPRTWPTNIQYAEDNEGQINWMKELELDHPIAIKWRLVVGKALAMDMGREPADSAVLRNWPTHYKMYDHHKGPARGNVRHDIYLYGPQSRRFRSPNEFVAHALWLCRDPTMDTKNCFCKYCKKIPQKIISSALDSIIQTTPSQANMSPTPSQAAPNATAGPSGTQVSAAGKDIYSALQKQAWARQLKDRDATSLAQRRAKREKRLQHKGKGKSAEGAEVPKVFAAVQKPLMPISALKPSQHVLEFPMLAQRNRDLRAVYSRSANDKAGYTSQEGNEPYGWPGESQENPPIRRLFRDHEVVWARLPGDGIVLQPGSPHRITEWPAVIDEFKVKNTPVHIDPPQNLAPVTSPGVGSTGSSQLQGKQPEILSVDRQTTLNIGSSSNSNYRSLTIATSPFSTQPSSSLATPSGLPIPPSSASSNAPSISFPPTNNASSTAFPSSATSGGRASPVLPPSPKSPNATATSTSEPDGAEPAEWIVQESTIYTVRLIGTNQKVNFTDRDVLPYLATVPSEELIDLLKAVPVQYMDFDRAKISKYDAIAAAKGQNDRMDEGLGEDRIAMYEGACAFAFALQIAADVCEFWSLTDKWEFKYLPPGYATGDVRVNIVSSTSNPQGGNSQQQQKQQPESISSAPAFRPVTTVQTTTITGGLSLSQAIEQAGRHNADVAAASEARAAETGPVYRETSSLSVKMSDQQVRETVAGVLGIGPRTLKNPGAGLSASKPTAQDHGRSAVPQHFTQVRFQGMWWGGERIWVDDFVRLKMGRKAVAPNGAPNVYKASGDGKKTAAFRAAAMQRALGGSGSIDGIDLFGAGANGKGKGREVDLSYFPELPEGANRRSVFMKINSLFVVDVRKRDGKVKKEGRVSGILYELADVDWEETEPDLLEEYENEKQQREEVLQRRSKATSSFQASVDESLLPSSKPPGTAKSPAPQPSPPDYYLIPQAPKHYRFRRIIKAGHEVVLNLSLVSGRYYPRLLSHPLVAGMVAGYEEDWKTVTYKYGNPFALEGLHPGHCSAVDPLIYKKSRVRMFEDADIQVQEQMARFKEDRIADEAEVNGQHDDAMDEDAGEESDELKLNTMLVD